MHIYTNIYNPVVHGIVAGHRTKHASTPLHHSILMRSLFRPLLGRPPCALYSFAYYHARERCNVNRQRHSNKCVDMHRRHHHRQSHLRGREERRGQGSRDKEQKSPRGHDGIKIPGRGHDGIKSEAASERAR